MEQTTPKKPAAKKTTKKRQLNSLPASLPIYNYEAFSYKDIQRAIVYFQAELGKLQKLLDKVPQIANKPANQKQVDYLPTEYNPIYLDKPKFYGVADTVVQQATLKLPAVSGLNPSSAGLAGSTLDTPMFGGMQPKAIEVIEPVVVEDNSEELIADIGALLSGN